MGDSSIDISQLRVDALSSPLNNVSFPHPCPGHLKSTLLTPSSLQCNSTLLSPRDFTRENDLDELRSEVAESPDTCPKNIQLHHHSSKSQHRPIHGLDTRRAAPGAKMSSNGSQKTDHTQEFSQWMVDASKSDGTSKQHTDRQQGLTYTPGQTGHVDLVSHFQQLASDLDTQYGELGTTPHHDVRTEMFPEERRFAHPVTPATNRRLGDKGDGPEVLFATPKLPTNPFSKQDGADDVGMGLSQVFRATQAPSSPMAARLPPPVPSSDRPSPGVKVKNTIDLPSDIVSDHSSPVFGNATRLIAAPSSTPTKGKRGPMQRAVTEPHTVYISRKESQEERERRSRLKVVPSPIDKDNAIVDAEFDQDARELQRRIKRRKIEKESKAIFDSIKAPPRSLPGEKRQAQAIAKEKGIQASSALMQVEPEAVVLLSDGVDDDSTEDETEPEENDNLTIVSEDRVTDENKENRGIGSVQVPMTGVQIKRGPYSHSTRLLSSPSARGGGRRHTRPLNKDDSEDELANLADLHVVNGSTRAPIAGKECEVINIADSQPSQRQQVTPSYDARKGAVGSSNDSGRVIPQSQNAKIPNSSMKSSSRLPQIAATSSQQNLSPPSSSPPQLRHDSKGTPTSIQHNLSGSIQQRVVSPSSSPPLLTGRPELSKVGSDPEPIAQISNQPAANPASNQQLVEQQSSVALGSHSNVSFKTAPQRQPERMPCSKEIQLSSTVPETSDPVFEARAAGGTTSTSGPVRGTSSRRTTPEDVGPPNSQHLSPNVVRCRRNGNSVQVTPKTHSPQRPRPFTSIAAEVQPSEGTDNADLDVGLFTADDSGFRQQMDELDGSSPIGPARKRRRGIGGRPIVPVEPSSVSKPDTTPNGLAKEPPLMSRVPTTEQEDELATGRRTSPVASRRLSLDLSGRNPETRAASSQQRNLVESPSKHRPIYSTRQTQRGQAAPEPPVEVTNVAKITSPKKGIPQRHNSKVHRTLMNGSTKDKGPDGHPKLHTINAPSRILAVFNGSPLAYFPATCLALISSPDPKYKIRFDDGTTTTVNVSAVKRFELREGDEIKLFCTGKRAQVYKVTGFENSTAAAEAAHDPRYPLTDMYGNRRVRVRPTKKSEPSAAGEEENIPITDVYLTLHMWQKLQDRQYTHLPTSSSASGLQTPTEPSSTPSTPSSRTRSAKVASNLSTNQRAITASKAMVHHKSDLFTDIVFVMTSIADEHRNKVQRSIIDNDGTLLGDGFDELFNIPPPESFSKPKAGDQKVPPSSAAASTGLFSTLALTTDASKARFALLLADTHCRTLKYFQALALGVPCIHTRWVSDCVRTGRLLDWRPYLLASGQSSFLGEATCSRTLTFNPLSGGTVALSEMIGTREKFLQGRKVLLVGGGVGGAAKAGSSPEGIMGAYVFIAYALGAARVGVVGGRKDAEDVLKKNGSGNSEGEWDWVCVVEDEKADAGASVGGRKRKRGGSGGNGGGSFVRDTIIVTNPEVQALERVTRANVRVVGTEVVVQSLILGRLLEE